MEMISVRTSVAAAVLAGGALALAACGSASPAPKSQLASLDLASGTAKQHNAAPDTGDLYRGPRTDAAALRWVELSKGSANGLSPIVHDGAGFTLYRFDKDSAHPPTSNCDGACATTWPPVLVKAGSKIFFNGVPRNAIGVVQRHDGKLQVTVGGWPVYRFSKDTGPGQTNGEGVGGTWFAVSPKVGEAGPGCKTLGRPFAAQSLALSGGPIKIWTAPNCTGTSKVVMGNVADLSSVGFTQPIASIRFGG
jgi:predicted lipoprotein with Yx(FWY)xxD motif